MTMSASDMNELTEWFDVALGNFHQQFFASLLPGQCVCAAVAFFHTLL